jgi:signal transduction histidine kinase
VETRDVVNFATKVFQLCPKGPMWNKLRNGNKPVVVDTITTRFLLLFLFLLSIPLTSVILFTVSLLVNRLEEADSLQLTITQNLMASQLDEATEKLNLLERVRQLNPESGQSPGQLCYRLQVGECLVVDHDQRQILMGSGHVLPFAKPGQALSFSPDLLSTTPASASSRPFYARLANQIYLLRRSESALSGHRVLFLGVPLNTAFFNRVYVQQPRLQPEIWLVGDDGATVRTLVVKTDNPQVDKQIPVAALLQKLRLAQANSAKMINLTLNHLPYLIRQDTLYSQSNQQIGHILYILPLSRNQLLLSNYYAGIYIIAVASLIFSVLLAMAAGRTITQPLLKLIRQVNLLSRENVSKDNPDVLITGVFEIHQLGEAFNLMMKRLRQEHKMRDDFVATLTHDLKVPLLAEKQTLAYLGQQTYGPLCPEQAEVLEALQSSNRSCLSLVTGLLEVYRYDSGEVFLMFDSFDLVTLLLETANEFQALAREKLITMNVESIIPNGTEAAFVYADRLEIKRVLGNLISNAIVNTPKHGVIHCKITNAEYYGGDTIYKVSSFQYTSLKFPVKLAERLLVTIQDSGLGFSNEDLASLFKQFAANKSRNPMSIGLGLYNCHQVLKAHKGVVWVESTEGEGSLVSFILPQNKKAAQDRRIFRDRRRYP